MNPSGKRSLVFSTDGAYRDLAVQIPCGRCIGCRLEKSRQWALRCLNEAKLSEKNCFITLTYEDAKLPEDYSISKREVQLFLKKLRNRRKEKIRYYACGEYGDKLLRPHYHALLFNCEFPDMVKLKHEVGVNGDYWIYASAELTEIWGKGFCTIGELNFQTAAYCAAYSMKKITGKQAEKHYERVVEETGEVVQVEPEFALMSRRPGIGKGWFDKYGDETYRDDYVIVNGVRMQPPKYYDVLFERTCLEGGDANPKKNRFDEIKAARKRKQARNKAENTPERLAVRETCRKAKLHSKRNVTDD